MQFDLPYMHVSVHRMAETSIYVWHANAVATVDILIGQLATA